MQNYKVMFPREHIYILKNTLLNRSGVKNTLLNNFRTIIGLMKI